MARRFIIRIELTQSAKGKLNEISDHNGMTQVSVMSRMVEWFASQPEIIQAAVLGRSQRDTTVIWAQDRVLYEVLRANQWRRPVREVLSWPRG